MLAMNVILAIFNLLCAIMCYICGYRILSNNEKWFNEKWFKSTLYFFLGGINLGCVILCIFRILETNC